MTKFLEHKDIYLRPQQEEDAAFFYTWNNDALTRDVYKRQEWYSLLRAIYTMIIINSCTKSDCKCEIL